VLHYLSVYVILWIVDGASQAIRWKTAKEKDRMSKDAKEDAQAEPKAQQQPAQQQQQVEVDDHNVNASYANFCRVMGSPEELIIDFGLNPQPHGVPKDPIAVKQRVIVNYYTAKRLLAALQMSVQHHEAVFGVLETDVQKRLRPQIAAAQQAAQQQAAAAAAAATEETAS
jgi:hypothetical protein